jgi:signal transduction histidine kinase
VTAPRTLFTKLLLLFLSFGALMTGVLLYMMHVSHERYHLQADQTVNRNLAREYVAANLLSAAPLTMDSLTTSLRRIASINPNIDLYVLDPDGNILGASPPDTRVLRRRVGIEPLKPFLDGRARLPLLGDDPTDSRHRAAFSVALLALPGTRAAYLYVVLERHDEAPAAGRLRTIYALGQDAGVVLAAILLAIVASILFLRVLTRRLGHLQQDMEQFRDSRFVTLPAPSGVGHGSPRDEVEQLRTLFVELAERVSAQMRELQSTDELRRELLANLSHDLRTPLTTLQAHLETLAMKELPAEERGAYLAIGLQQCRRLVGLLEQLLELAKLDAQAVTCLPEPFQIAELVQDIVLKFSLTARRAGVTLTMKPPSQDVPLVMGDIALIERVLANLLDNAIRHAQTGGLVTVSVDPAARVVRVAVHDNGPGISEGARAQVFDRFYRGDKSRSSTTGQAGLGLSIARGILELHGSGIDFVSSAKEGTTFFFDLPSAPTPGVPHSPDRPIRSVAQ